MFKFGKALGQRRFMDSLAIRGCGTVCVLILCGTRTGVVLCRGDIVEFQNAFCGFCV